MGLDYSISMYVRKEKISNCLNWLYTNSWVHDNKELDIYINQELLKIKGDQFKVPGSNEFIGKDNPINNLHKLHFTTSLVFDIDPKILSCLGGWELNYSTELLSEFKEHFEQLYQGNGKIRIGGFDTRISKLINHEVYEVTFMAVTTDMSKILETSISVKKWILEFSIASESILSFIDLEYNGQRVLFYRGKEIDITLKEGFEAQSHDFARRFLAEFYSYEYDMKFEK